MSPRGPEEHLFLCARRDVLVIVDVVQMGCGRTGSFFSFESAGITPDIVCLSESIGGYGLQLALTLFRPELDVWEPGEHSGTFRGISPAFVAVTAALRNYWTDDKLEKSALATAGPDGEVVKLMPPLTITDDELDEGLALVAAAVTGALT